MRVSLFGPGVTCSIRRSSVRRALPAASPGETSGPRAAGGYGAGGCLREGGPVGTTRTLEDEKPLKTDPNAETDDVWRAFTKVFLIIFNTCRGTDEIIKPQKNYRSGQLLHSCVFACACVCVRACVGMGGDLWVHSD